MSDQNSENPAPPVKKVKVDPLHGKTLEQILKELVHFYGWPYLGKEIDIRCFNLNPTITSSLKFLRRTPWARTKLEKLYLDHFYEQRRRTKV
jgi:uncharacterized protein (DUF2132 family)